MSCCLISRTLLGSTYGHDFLENRKLWSILHNDNWIFEDAD